MNRWEYRMRGTRLCRDSRHAAMFGVCAGIAHHFGWRRWWVRAGVLAAGFFAPMPVVAAYVIAGLLLPDCRLDEDYGAQDECRCGERRARRRAAR